MAIEECDPNWTSAASSEIIYWTAWDFTSTEITSYMNVHMQQVVSFFSEDSK
jgi:hypothetical protein